MELSPTLENVDIRAWAQQIRKMKIREFQEYIRNVKTIFDARKDNMHPIAYVKDKQRIAELEKKLQTLKNAK